MSRRIAVAKALTKALQVINGVSPYKSNLYTKNVISKLKFWDEVRDFPFVCVVPGMETREYLPSSFSWGILNVSLKLYTYGEDSAEKLENLIGDIETVITNNENLVVDVSNNTVTTEILITSITTDEGLLDPYGIGEILLQVRYPIERN
jgi:hypothetical protein